MNPTTYEAGQAWLRAYNQARDEIGCSDRRARAHADVVYETIINNRTYNV